MPGYQGGTTFFHALHLMIDAYIWVSCALARDSYFCPKLETILKSSTLETYRSLVNGSVGSPNF